VPPEGEKRRGKKRGDVGRSGKVYMGEFGEGEKFVGKKG